jgi:hypothetical protein
MKNPKSTTNIRNQPQIPNGSGLCRFKFLWTENLDLVKLSARRFGVTASMAATTAALSIEWLTA